MLNVLIVNSAIRLVDIYRMLVVILSCDGPWPLGTKMLFYPKDVIKVQENLSVACKSKKESKCAIVVD
jgi:hypothetical protein